jgi:alpha-mannosidase
MAQRRPLEEVVVVFKTHFDIGYTDLARNVVTRYRTTMIDKALSVIDRSQSLPPEHRFVWTVSGWPMAQILWPGQEPERRRRVLEAFRRGQFATHALPFSTHTESLDLEDIVRGLEFSSSLHRSLGLPLARDAKMTDVPSHSWAMPTLLHHAGVRFLHIGCNAASSSPEVPLLFWWEGPDGSRTLTMYSATGYGSELTPPKDWTHPVWLALIHTGDNQGPPEPESVEKLIAEGREKLPGVRIRFGRLSDFSDALLKTRPDLPLIRGDMPDTWIHGLESMPAETALARNTRSRIAAVEALHGLLDTWAPGAAPPADIAAAREQTLLYGEHTWGMDAKRFPRLYGDAWKKELNAGRYQKAEESYAEHGSYARKASAIASPALFQHVNVLARSVNVEGRRIVVYNPLAWTRDGVVELGNTRFVARNVPPLGYRTFREQPLGAPALENEHLRIKPGRGGIASLIDKHSGRELVNTRAEFTLGQYVYERFSNVEVNRFFDAYVKSRAEWAFGDFGKPGLPDAPYQRTLGTEMPSVTLYPGSRYIDITWSITAKEPDPWPEAGWLAFPLNIKNPSFRLARLGGIIDPAKDTVRGANNEVFCLNSGLAVLDERGSGVGLCPIDSPLVSLGHPGLWRYTKQFDARPAIVFVNLFNNQWSTNFAQWVGGSWTSRVRLWPIANFDAARDLIVPSLEARSPLIASEFDGPAGNLPNSQAGIAVSRPGVVVTAFDGTILRLWEHAGTSGVCTVTLPAGNRIASVQPCDLRGNATGQPVPVRDGQFTIEINRYAPATFRLA